MPIIIDEEEFRLIFTEPDLGSIFPIPVEDLHDITVLIMHDLAILFLILIPEESIIPIDAKRSPGIRKDIPLLPVYFESGLLLLALPPDEEIASRCDMDIPGVLKIHGKRGREELIPGAIGFELSDSDFSLRIRNSRFEENEDGSTAS